jgi:hypothetical protein
MPRQFSFVDIDQQNEAKAIKKAYNLIIPTTDHAEAQEWQFKEFIRNHYMN